MSAIAWEVVPPLGASITPNCEEFNQSSVEPTDGRAENDSNTEVDVSRETSTSGKEGANRTTPENVSRETSVLDPSVSDSEVRSGTLSSIAAEPDSSDAAVVPEPETGDVVSVRGDDAPREDTEGAEYPELPVGMASVESVKRALGMDTAARVTTEAVKILAVANQKGGVGKTTSAVNLAAALALLGYEVLLIDMDPQGNATTALGVEHAPGTLSTYEVLIDGKSLLDVVQPSPGLPGLTVAPATVDLAGAEIELVSEMGREGRLRSALIAYMAEHEKRHRRLDFVLVDCPPSLGLLTINALAAVDEILIPLQCEYYALEGLGQLMGSVGLVREYLNPTLSIAGIVLTMYDGRTKLAPQVADEARTHFPELVFEAIIPRSVRISEAPSYSQTVLTYDPSSVGAKAYVACARELAKR
jgi:chromosome partitioning protein